MLYCPKPSGQSVATWSSLYMVAKPQTPAAGGSHQTGKGTIRPESLQCVLEEMSIRFSGQHREIIFFLARLTEVEERTL